MLTLTSQCSIYHVRSTISVFPPPQHPAVAYSPFLFYLKILRLVLLLSYMQPANSSRCVMTS